MNISKLTHDGGRVAYLNIVQKDENKYSYQKHKIPLHRENDGSKKNRGVSSEQ